MQRMRNFLGNKNIMVHLVSHYSSSTIRHTSNIVIPTYVQRGPTDILKAIAGTIRRDTNAPHYKFHDDPYLIPWSGSEKKVYALSKEAGRKAARFIKDTHQECFTDPIADPVIVDFLPKIQYDENSEVSDCLLLDLISNMQVADAIKVYDICKSKGIDVKTETMQALLEILCYYNENEETESEWTEEVFTKPVEKDIQMVKSWKEQGLAEEIFLDICDEGVKPYCAMIRGTCAYHQVDRASELYNEALSKGFQLDTETFNAFICLVPMLKGEGHLRWGLLEEILYKMVEQKVPPNLNTLNGILEVISCSRHFGAAEWKSLAALAEFKLWDIEPFLTSYYYLLKIFYKRGSPPNGLMLSILDELEKIDGHLEVKNLKDNWFFHKAMDVCCNNFQSFELSQRLHRILMSGDNFDFIGVQGREHLYFRNYFKCAIKSLPVEQFMQIYDDHVPNIYTPDKDVMEEMLKACGAYENLAILPRIWSDMIMYQHAWSERLMELIMMVISRQAIEKQDPVLIEQLSNIAYDIWTRLQNQDDEKHRKVEWTGNMLGDCISILAKCGSHSRTAEIMTALDQNLKLKFGQLSIEHLQLAFESALLNKDFPTCLAVLKNTKKYEYPEAASMVLELNEKMELNDLEKNQINSL